jgi:imidazolonepropionase-like amidohydrolase
VHLRATLRAGVTGYLDLGSSARRIFEYRRRIAAGKLLGPDLFAAGPLVTTSGGHPCYEGSPVGDSCLPIDAPADVSKLAGLWKQQPDVLKLVIEGGTQTSPLPRMDTSSIKAVVAAARARGVPLVAHVSAVQDVIDGLDSGVRIFAHMPAYDLIDAQLLARLVKEKAVIIPTMAVYEGLYLLANGKLELDQGRLGSDVPAPVLAALASPQYTQYTPLYQGWTKGVWDNARANLKACVKAGVTLAAGTDAGNPATFHGLALHRELQLYVEEGGMSPAQALATATRGARRVLGLSDRGALEAGQRADLLVVSGDPTTKIAATAEIAEVFVRGRRLDRKALELGGSGTLELAVVKGLTEGQPCLASGECAAGLTCDPWGARCTPTCDALTGSGCKPGTVCYAASTGAAKGYCYKGDGCDLFKQDCANDAACIWMGNATTVCWYASPANTAGGACSASGTCAKGLQCNGYTKSCYELCHPTDPGKGPCAGSGQVCQDLSSYAGQAAGQCM